MRLTKRKRKILETLAISNPPGVSLLNELRLNCIGNECTYRDLTNRHDKRKSFNRTVLENFDLLYIHELAERYATDLRLTTGIFARWAFSELLEQGYISKCPEPDEIIFIVGRDACSAFIPLKNNQLAVVGTAVFLSKMILVTNRELNDEDIRLLSAVPWKVYSVKNSTVECDPYRSLAELSALPTNIAFPSAAVVSTAKKRFIIR